MRYYASLYMSPWKSTRDLSVPPGAQLSDNLHDALLWFLEHPWKKLKPRTPVVLLVDINTLPDQTAMRGYRRREDGTRSFRVKQRHGGTWQNAIGRFLPTHEDFLCVATEKRMLSLLPGVAASVDYVAKDSTGTLVHVQVTSAGSRLLPGTKLSTTAGELEIQGE